MLLTVQPPYWLTDTFAMICEICAVAVWIDLGGSTCGIADAEARPPACS